MKIIVDIMGGDHSPDAQLRAVCQASRAYASYSFVLVGDEGQMHARAAELGLDLSGFEIHHTADVLTMEDAPLSVVRSAKNSSMAIALQMLADGAGDAVVSAGNTGALYAGATLIVRKIPGVSRPTIGALFPFQTPVLLVDSGANLTVNTEQYVQFAVMGSTYMQQVLGIREPRVGLLNNGIETCKGTEDRVEAYPVLAGTSDIHFVGNIEATAATEGKCDVLVTDGFSGNIFLKAFEGTGNLLLSALKDMFVASPKNKIAAWMIRKDVRALKKRFDAREYGGAPILGVKKPVIKAHGSSDEKAFFHAIRQAIAYADSGVIPALEVAMAPYDKKGVNGQ